MLLLLLLLLLLLREPQLPSAVLVEAGGDGGATVSATLNPLYADEDPGAALPIVAAPSLTASSPQKLKLGLPPSSSGPSSTVEKATHEQVHDLHSTKPTGSSTNIEGSDDLSMPVYPSVVARQDDHRRSESMPMVRVDFAFHEHVERRPRTAPVSSTVQHLGDNWFSQEAHPLRSCISPTASSQPSLSNATASCYASAQQYFIV